MPLQPNWLHYERRPFGSGDTKFITIKFNNLTRADLLILHPDPVGLLFFRLICTIIKGNSYIFEGEKHGYADKSNHTV